MSPRIISTIAIGIACLFLFVAIAVRATNSSQIPQSPPTPVGGFSQPPQSWNHLTGGTLHQATISQWHQATPQNRLATAADHIISLYPTLTAQETEARAQILIDTIALIMRPEEPRPDHPMPKVFAMFIPTLEIEHGWMPAR